MPLFSSCSVHANVQSLKNILTHLWSMFERVNDNHGELTREWHSFSSGVSHCCVIEDTFFHGWLFYYALILTCVCSSSFTVTCSLICVTVMVLYTASVSLVFFFSSWLLISHLHLTCVCILPLLLHFTQQHLFIKPGFSFLLCVHDFFSILVYPIQCKHFPFGIRTFHHLHLFCMCICIFVTVLFPSTSLVKLHLS